MAGNEEEMKRFGEWEGTSPPERWEIQSGPANVNLTLYDKDDKLCVIVMTHETALDMGLELMSKGAKE